MSRRGGARAASRTDNPVSLFPFLSVLVCTMGMLFMMLVVINRHARIQAAEKAGIKTDEIVAEFDIEARTLEMFAQDMIASKEQAATEIYNEQARLATLESVIENLKAEIQRNAKTLKELDADHGNTNSEIGKHSEQLAAKHEALQRAEAELGEMQKNAANRKQSYAIVPYRGIDGTERRPIYIECRSDCVILHPEGIVLREDDFLTASHPDNPLDALMRAAGLFYTERESVSQNTKPYPLIVVRPGGIDAYYAVRESLQAWGEQFGYELVADDWNLEFPPPNEALRHRLEAQLVASRERMMPVKAMLLQRYMAANRLGGNVANGNIANGNAVGRTGGYVGGHTPGISQYEAERLSGQMTGASQGIMPNGMATDGTALTGMTPGGMYNGAVQGGLAPNGAMPNGMVTDGTASTGMTPGGMYNGAAQNGLAPNGAMPNGNWGSVANNASNMSGTGEMSGDFSEVDWRDVMATVGNQTAATNKKRTPKVEYRLGPNGDMVRYEDGVPREKRIDPSKIAAREKASGSNAMPLAPGEIRLPTASPSQIGPSYGDSYGNASQANVDAQSLVAQSNLRQIEAAHNGATSQIAGPQPAYSGMTSANQGTGDPSQAPGGGIPSLDMTFGDKETQKSKGGWAMQELDFNKTEIVRPIVVECLPDKLIIKRVAGAGVDRTVDIPPNGNLYAVENTVASHILEYIDTWGGAVRGTYWQPELNVIIHSGAELRYEELKSLLQNSGVRIVIFQHSSR